MFGCLRLNLERLHFATSCLEFGWFIVAFCNLSIFWNYTSLPEFLNLKLFGTTILVGNNKFRLCSVNSGSEKHFTA